MSSSDIVSDMPGHETRPKPSRESMKTIFCKDCRYRQVWPCCDLGCPPDRCGSPKRNRTAITYSEPDPVLGRVKYGGEREDILCRDRNKNFDCDWFVRKGEAMKAKRFRAWWKDIEAGYDRPASKAGLVVATEDMTKLEEKYDALLALARRLRKALLSVVGDCWCDESCQDTGCAVLRDSAWLEE